MRVKIYHNPRCATSRKVLQALKEHGVELEVVEYLKHPPTPEELREIMRKGNLRVQDLLRKRDKVYKEKFADAELSEDEWLEAIQQYPSILERPLCVSETHAAVCRPPDRYREFIG